MKPKDILETLSFANIVQKTKILLLKHDDEQLTMLLFQLTVQPFYYDKRVGKYQVTSNEIRCAKFVAPCSK